MRSAQMASVAAGSRRSRKVSTGLNMPIHTRRALHASLARIPGGVPGLTVFGALAIVAALIVQSATLAREASISGPRLRLPCWP